MSKTPFHAYYDACRLANLAGENGLVPAFESVDIKIYPYQIAAAEFALRSPYLKGCILCDEGSLGKTFEALLVATQKWYEGKMRQLVILPVNLVKQWTDKIENSFTVPYIVLDNNEVFSASENENPFDSDAVIITTYDFAVEKAEYIKRINWDLIILDEADCLNKAYTENNKLSSVLKSTLNGFKLLLTPTPIEMDIRDIYGLIYFIDETVLPDINEFYARYFRKPENYGELTEWVSKFCFRTLKSQVTDYVNFSRRVPYTVSCDFTKDEQKLYDLVNTYLEKPVKIAYPKMERYDLTIMHTHILSSSPQAYVNTVSRAIERLNGIRFDGELEKQRLDEIAELTKIKVQCEKVKISGKCKMLLELIKKCLPKLKQIKAPQKAIIFTDNLTTLKLLASLLADKGYNALVYSGANSRDYSVMERFRNGKDIQILLATDEAAKGLDIEFCPLVINYDMLTNATELEQRISRCHRQGQKSDVIVINLFNKGNYADVRYMELINKRVLQFSGIFGLSDTILGNFDLELDEVFSKLRHTADIGTDFALNLEQHEQENKETVENAENILFTTFTKEIADKVTVTPQYLKQEIERLNTDLWEVVSDYIKRNESDEFIIDETEKTIKLIDRDNPPRLFYYWNGSRNVPYKSLAAYGMGNDFKPRSGRITLSSVITRGVFQNIECADSGAITVDADIEPCKIGFYVVEIFGGDDYAVYNILTGRTENGAVLSDEACQRLLSLPVTDYSENDKATAYWLRNASGQDKSNELDRQIRTDELKQQAIEKSMPSKAEQISLMKLKNARAKGKLSRDMDEIKDKISQEQKKADNAVIRLEKIKIEKVIKLLQKDLREQEENQFLNALRLDNELEKQIEELQNSANIKCKVKRQFILDIQGI